MGPMQVTLLPWDCAEEANALEREPQLTSLSLPLPAPVFGHSVQPGHWLQGRSAQGSEISKATGQLSSFSMRWPIRG